MSQKSLYLVEKFGAFKVAETKIPHPKAGEILVKVQGAGLNPLDWKIQAYGIFIENYPAVLGTDISGDVAELGEGVEGFSKGDTVFFQGYFDNEHAGYQQFTMVPADLVAKIPKQLSYAQAASLPVTVATAAIALFSEKPAGLGLNPTLESKVQLNGQTAFVIGGSSNVGQYAIQLLKWAGFSQISAYASGRHTERLKSLGATEVIDRTKVSIDQLPAVAGAEFGIVFDTVSSKETQEAGVLLLADPVGGSLIVVGNPQVDKKKNVLFVRGSVHAPENREFGKILFKKFPTWLEEGVLEPNPVEELANGLYGIPVGLERLKKGEVSGLKLIGLPQERS